MNVKIIRLISGEEMLCSVTDNGDTITIKNPAVLIPSPEGKLLMAKWMPYANDENGFTLGKNFIMFIVEPQTDLANHYSTTFINNLFIPGKKTLETSSLKLTV
jgi:hypothetical protein